MPIVSVIIPCYNNSEYLPLSVGSVLRQTYLDFEIIIADDGSTDSSRLTADNIIRENSHKLIRYVYQENKGPSAARNLGISNAQGKYLAFLDADDEWLPGKLAKQVAYLDSHPPVGIVGCGNYIIDEEGAIIKEVKGNSYKPREMILSELLIRNVIHGSFSGALIRGECFKEAGLFDETFRGSEDREMIFRIISRYDIHFIEDTLIKYRFHLNNSHKNIAMMQANQRHFIEKHKPNYSFLNRQRAYGYIYLDAGREYVLAGHRMNAMKNALMAILIYPFKICEDDNKYQMFAKTLFPGWVVSLLRLVKGKRKSFNDNPIA